MNATEFGPYILQNAQPKTPPRGADTAGHSSRRSFLKALLAGGGVVALGNCGYYSPAQGDAYAPWQFPVVGEERQLSLVHAALLAASPHNTQPWLFQLLPGVIRLRADLSRNLGAMDPLRRELHVGLGCALENMMIAAGHSGFAATLSYPADAADPSLVADIALVDAAPVDDPLFSAISLRRTNRGLYGDFPLDPRIQAQLAQLTAGDPSVTLDLLTSAAQRLAFRDGTIAATHRIVDDPEMAAASHAWFRYTKAAVDQFRDGLSLDAQDLDAWTGFLAKTVGPTDLESDGAYWLNFTDGQTAAVSAFGILSTAALLDPQQILSVGRVYQRLHLWATHAGLAVHPLNQMAERRDRELQLGLAPEFGGQLAALTAQGRNAQMLFRIGYAWDEPNHSPRRPVSWVVQS